MIGDLRVKLGPVTVDETSDSTGARRDSRRAATACASVPASQPVLLGQIQPPGKKLMNAADWARGARLDESAQAQ